MTRKILLVDDSATVLMMERMILASERFQIVTATNGEEAQERARAEQPDLILMDIVMPKRNGIDACKLSAAGSDRGVIAIGASTGGPEARRLILSALPKECPPVVVAQHMPAGFTRAFAAMLDRECTIEVREAAAGDVLRPGLALIAPGGRHLTLKRAGGHLLADLAGGPLVSRHRPSVDVLFESVARQLGPRAVAVLLTGMGDDGARGLLALHGAGAATLAQDEASSVVYGMPKAAFELGAARDVCALEAMADAILRRL